MSVEPGTWHSALDAAAGLAPLASLLPLLVVLYRDDVSYHLTTAGPQAPTRLLAAYAFGLALVGLGVARLLRVPSRFGGVAAQALPGSEQPLPAATALITGALAVAAMTGLNLGWFGPLATRIPVGASGAVLVAGNLVSLGTAAFLAAQAVGAPSPAAIVLFAAWLAFAPLGGTLPLAPIGASVLVAALGLFALARVRQRGASGVGAALVAAGLAAAWMTAHVAGSAAALFWSAPHEQNTAAGAFFSRLYSGPGGLTATEAQPVAAAEALTAGTLACLGLLTLGLLWRVRPLMGVRALTAACLALVATLALWPTTPPTAAAVAPLALAPFVSPLLWSGAPAGRRIWLAGFVVGGYLLAGTSDTMLSRSATELLTRWPAIASLPALGLVLLALALAIALRSLPYSRPPVE